MKLTILRKLSVTDWIGGALALLGVTALVAGIAGLVPASGAFSMSSGVALCFVLSGAALLAQSHESRRRQLQMVFGGAILLLAGLGLGQNLLQILLHKEVFPYALGLSLTIALAFILTGLILVLMHGVRVKWAGSLLQLLSAALILVGLLDLVDDIFDLDVVYDWYQHQDTPTISAVGIFILGTGLYALIERIDWYGKLGLNREDRKITIVSAILLSAIVFSCGLATFAMMAREMEEAFKNSLAITLESRVRLFENALDSAIDDAIFNGRHPRLNTLMSKVSAGAGTAGEREAVVGITDRITSSGRISAITIFDAAGRKIAHKGKFATDTNFKFALPLKRNTTLLWRNGFILNIKIENIESDKYVGFLNIDVPLPKINALYHELSGLGQTGSMLVCSAYDSESVACPPTFRRYLPGDRLPRDINGRPSPMARALTGETGVVNIVGYRGKEVIVAYAPIGSLGLGMIVKMDRAEMYQPIRTRFEHTLLLLLVLVAVGVILLRWRIAPLVSKLMSEISERKRAEEDSRLLQTISHAVGEAKDIHAALEIVLRKVCETTGWQLGQAWVPRPDGTVLECSPAWYTSVPGAEKFRLFSKGMTFTPGLGIVGRAWLSKKPEWMLELALSKIARRASLYGEIDLRFGSGVPILAGDEVVAVMEFFTSELHPEDTRLVALISFVAAQLGVVIQRERAQTALDASEERYRELIQNSVEAIYFFDPETKRVTEANAAFLHLLGYTADEASVLTIYDFVAYPKVEIDAFMERIFTLGSMTGAERIWRRKDGRLIDVHVTANTIRHQGKDVGFFVGRDISERKRMEAALHESEERYRTLIHNCVEAIYLYDPETKTVLEGNSAFSNLLGYTAEEISGLSMYDFIVHNKESVGSFSAALKTNGGIAIGERIWRSKDGRLINMDVTAGRIFTGNRSVGFTIARDITAQKQAEERLHYLAHYDELTGLPNRILFNDRLKQAMIEAAARERLVALMFLDLDRFKTINDTLGHEAGDVLLKAVAERLKDCVRRGDSVARLGGDEFTLVLADMAHINDVSRMAQKILDSFTAPFRIGERDLFITPSIGITLYPFDQDNANTLLKNADTAMYRAKEQGRNNYQFYTSEMNAQALERLSFETHLRQALERNEFLLHYQPQVDLVTGDIIGMEALLRWQNPELGLVSPAEFIPLAEETGLIVSIGEWVIRTACKQNKAWQAAGLPPLRVSVNLSARQFKEQNLVERVAQVLNETGLEARYLELELTESLLQNPEATITPLKELHALGVYLSIDDFGTGYSSLSYLKRFPIDTIKIDRSFVRDITTDADDAAIANAIITMAHSLGMHVVAEGVETGEQLAFLCQRKCDSMQGYYFSKPLPADAFAGLLKDGRRLTLSQRRISAEIKVMSA